MDSESLEIRLARIVAEVRARRAAGESLPDAEVLAAHPALREPLALELRKLSLVQHARRLAAAESRHDAVDVRTVGAKSAADTAATPVPAGAVASIPGYEILREIHRGGQGVVYHAIQRSTKREVAVKVIREGPFADPYDRIRFEREVQILSALKHPNIVSIHDSGVAAGFSYFVMDYIAGEPLDEYVARAHWDASTVLRLFAKICDAVNAAQLHGIIHRDLKPGNVRIDERGEPHVLDFGLAKVTSPSAETDVERGPATTVTGQFVGSLPWAAPEQLDGAAGHVDLRTDVYSLGVILFQALTGCFPYPVQGTLREVLDNIQNAAPMRPSTIRRDINDEVETIVLKCLQKDRARRYQSAADLSADVKRYLNGEPIDAKRDSHLYVFRKQLRRYRVGVGAVLAVFLSLIAGIIGTIRATWRAQQAESVAQAFAHAESILRENADWETYKACLVAADAALAVNNSAAAKARLEAAPARMRGWEWRHLTSRLDQSTATHALPGSVNVRFAQSADRRSIFVAIANALLKIDPLSGQSSPVVSLQGAAITALALSSDGQRIALGHEGNIHVIRPDGAELLRFHASTSVAALAFSPNRALLASVGAAGDVVDRIRIWDASTGDARTTLPTPDAWVTVLAFHPSGGILASGHTKANAGFCLWDLESGREKFSADYGGLDVNDIEFSPDGTMFAVASQASTIKLYDTASGRELRALNGHIAAANDVTFSSDGEHLASASIDQTLRVWDTRTGRAISCRRGHSNSVSQVAFLSDSNQLLSMSAAESKLKVWDARETEEPLTFDTGKYFVLLVSFSTDGSRLYSHQRCWDTASGALLARLSARPGWDANSWMGVGAALEWASNAPREHVSELLRDGNPLVHCTEAMLFRPIASPRGDCFAVGLQRGVIQLFSRDGKLIREMQIDPLRLRGVAFSHDGKKVLTGTDTGEWTLWDVTSGAALLTRKHGMQELVNAAFSEDDRLIATASYDGAARICNALSGEELHTLRASAAPSGDQSVVWSVAFSPDGTRLATGSKDRRIRIWDVANGQELFSLTRHAGTVMCLAWSPDGTQLASGGYDGTVCLWDSLPRAERLAKTHPITVEPRN